MSRTADGAQNSARRLPPPSLFAKLFQISAISVQGFPKIPLAVLWDFNVIGGPKPPKSCILQTFSPPRRLERASDAPSCGTKRRPKMVKEVVSP
jgi:hypothetical protein